MTALCGGGPSAAKSGDTAVSYFAGNELENLVQQALGISEFWASIVVYLVSANWDWNALCATDPPAIPTFTAQDIAAIVLQPLTSVDLPYQKLSDLVLHAAWFYGCECTSVATPAPPPWPPIPTGAMQPGNPAPVNGTSGACSDIRQSLTTQDTTVGVLDIVDHTAQWLPGSPVGGLTYLGQTTTGRSVPPECVSINFTGALSNNLGQSTNAGWAFATFTAAGVLVTDLELTATPGQGAINATWTKQSTEVSYALLWKSDTSSQYVFTVDLEAKMTCSGSGTIVQPCCPPDPALMAAIQRLLNFAQDTNELATLIQRYSAPFAYVQGPIHAGLTGSGSFAIPRSLGMQANVTQYPPANPTFTGQPTYITDLGWMSVESADGFIDEIRLTRSSQLWMSRVFQAGTTFGYALRDGVTVNFTELHAEP